MNRFTKIVVLLSVVLCVLLGAGVWVWGSRVMRLFRIRNYDGYHAPVYSPDGRYVYFVERNTRGTAMVTNVRDLLSSPKYDVSVDKDTFTLKRLHIESGRIEELTHLSPSPIEGQHYEGIGSPFHYSRALLRFTKEGPLTFDVCLTVDQQPRARSYLSSGVWTESKNAAEISSNWKEASCMLGGDNESPLFGDWELLEARGDYGLFPAAIIAYNHVDGSVKVLVKNKDYNRLYPNGVPLDYIKNTSRRAAIERLQTVMRTHKELMQKHRASGMTEIEAELQTTRDMQRLGYYPKPTMIVARRLRRDEIGTIDKEVLFSIAKGEMESGIFQDIERAIAKPGEEFEKDSSTYHIHRDYSNSARLNAFLESGKMQFYVRYLDETYELTIKKP